MENLSLLADKGICSFEDDDVSFCCTEKLILKKIF